MGLRAGLDRCGKSRPPPGFDPRTVQPVGSRYTDYATRPIYVNSGIKPLLRHQNSLCSGVIGALGVTALHKLSYALAQ